MKYYTPGWVIMSLIVVGILFGDWKVYQKMQVARMKAASQEKEISAYRAGAQVAQIQYARYWGDYKIINDFLKPWRANLGRTKEDGTLAYRGSFVAENVNSFSALAKEVTGKDEQRALAFELTAVERVADYPIGGQPAGAQQYACLVRGPYHQVVNWLGLLEEKYPVAKIDAAQMRVESDAVVLSMKMVFPEIDVGQVITGLDGNLP